MFGLPIDANDGPGELEAWRAAQRPAYELLAGLTEAQVAPVKSLVLDRLKLDAVPATIVTDAAGNVLLTQWGPPTISKIRELLAEGRGSEVATRSGRCGREPAPAAAQ
jgi:hypothetical protein